jgi:uncharacterized protein
VFKRRTRLTTWQAAARFFYPRGGWTRAVSYTIHRLRRLPDRPHRIARGIFAGIFVSFSPLFGFHFILAALVAWAIRGNILASLIATFFGNPITFPIIMSVSVELGNWMLGQPGGMQIPQVVAAFSRASVEMWHNIASLFTDDVAHWTSLGRFFHRVFLPYLVGGLIPGFIAGMAGYYLSLPLIGAYQKRRAKKIRARFDQVRADIAQRVEEEAARVAAEKLLADAGAVAGKGDDKTTGARRDSR